MTNLMEITMGVEIYYSAVGVPEKKKIPLNCRWV